MLCITNNSIAPAGRSSQFGDGIYSQSTNSPCASTFKTMLFRLIVPIRILDAESLHTVAHGSERQPQQLGGGCAIKSGLLQSFQQCLFLDTIKICLLYTSPSPRD